jgi:hypothetical protein
MAAASTSANASRAGFGFQKISPAGIFPTVERKLDFMGITLTAGIQRFD